MRKLVAMKLRIRWPGPFVILHHKRRIFSLCSETYVVGGTEKIEVEKAPAFDDLQATIEERTGVIRKRQKRDASRAPICGALFVDPLCPCSH